jgi:hypothetical protein
MTAVANGTLVNTPSDSCTSSPLRLNTFCERKVTSIVCLHAPRETAAPTTPTDTPTTPNDTPTTPTAAPTTPTDAPTGCPPPIPAKTDAPTVPIPAKTDAPTVPIPAKTDAPTVPTANQNLEASQFWYTAMISLGLLIGMGEDEDYYYFVISFFACCLFVVCCVYSISQL